MRGRDGLSGLFQSFQGFGGISVRLSKTFSGSVYLILIPFRVLVGFLRAAGCRGGKAGRMGVSIPFRVLVRFLRYGLRTQTRYQDQPQVSIPFRVLVRFLPVDRFYELEPIYVFQSLSGFW